MATNFPTSLDTFVNPAGTDNLATVNHASQHDNINDAVAALEAKVGINGSAVTSSLDYKINNISSGATGLWSPTAQGLFAMTCDPSTANQGSNVTNVGTPYYTGIQLQAAATITKVYAYCSNSGTANHYACIYSAAGNLLVQSSLVAGSTAGNLVTWTVASTALSAGNYMVMLYSTSASGSITSFQRANSGSLPATILNVGMSSPFFRCATGSQTTLTTTAPSTTGTLTANNFGPMWIALGP